jgi:putative ABC transport system permease protein
MAELLVKARAIPGVESAALVGYLPLDMSRWSQDDTVHVEGRTPSRTAPDVTAVNWFGPGYLGTAGIRLLKGRDFGSADVTDSAPIAIVNETFVARYLSGHEPIGALFTSSDWKGMTFTIVGVIQDQRQWGPASAALPEVYLPQGQFDRNEQARGDGAMLVVKSCLRLGRMEAALRAAAAPLRSEVSLGATRPVEDYLASYFQQRRFQLHLAIAFALAALGLAAVGVYGAMAFSVVQRRRELAVRAALGAQRRQLFGLVLVRGARLTLLGISFGLASALFLSRLLASLLYGVGERDPLTFTIVAMTLAVVALAASLLPAITAARLDPMRVLRRE